TSVTRSASSIKTARRNVPKSHDPFRNLPASRLRCCRAVGGDPPISHSTDFFEVTTMRISARLGVWAMCVCALMIAHTPLTAGSAHVILDLRPNGAVEFMVRSANGGSTSWLSGSTQAAPAWLKLTRTGTTVTGFVSSNGTTWTQVGTTTLSTAAYTGLVVT